MFFAWFCQRSSKISVYEQWTVIRKRIRQRKKNGWGNWQRSTCFFSQSFRYLIVGSTNAIHKYLLYIDRNNRKYVKPDTTEKHPETKDRQYVRSQMQRTKKSDVNDSEDVKLNCFERKRQQNWTEKIVIGIGALCSVWQFTCICSGQNVYNFWAYASNQMCTRMYDVYTKIPCRCRTHNNEQNANPIKWK